MQYRCSYGFVVTDTDTQQGYIWLQFQSRFGCRFGFRSSIDPTHANLINCNSRSSSKVTSCMSVIRCSPARNEPRIAYNDGVGLNYHEAQAQAYAGSCLGL